MDDNRIVELYLSRDESAIRETPAESLRASDSSFIHSKTPPIPGAAFCESWLSGSYIIALPPVTIQQARAAITMAPVKTLPVRR